MRKLYQVKLSASEIKQLEEMRHAGKHKAQILTRARILLKAGVGWSDKKIAEGLEVCERTVQRTRQKYCTEGLEAVLRDKPKSGTPKKFEPNQIATVIATACGPSPAGYSQWSVRLLADKMVELGVADISREGVRRILKKTNCNPTVKSSGVSKVG